MKQGNVMKRADILNYLKQYIYRSENHILYRVWQASMLPIEEFIIENQTFLLAEINKGRAAMGLDKIIETE